MMRRSFPLAGMMMIGVLLAGCDTGRDFSDIRARMAELDERPSGRVPDVPEYEAQELFFYSAADLRSPFQSFIEEQQREAEQEEDTGVDPPDEDREREPLEAYGLDELRMVGHIQREGESIRALVTAPGGTLYQVQSGQYMGRNYGRVVVITSRRIDLVETVPSGRGGWLERPQSLSLAE
ncbi:pilus assembly protein PilP [Natronospirillum operosum]|uniref:Pilus assembly protein PilP n=1 Tax=Natronospirillum operosum TaxID=2759953 RepID=A0A4Z0WEC1_9GAMM|nr:pilus assembly protein PilP [Natronospirillum operosum]TGG93281.1 pilus assembly protein PilP [Natronospirillum operosum]